MSRRDLDYDDDLEPEDYEEEEEEEEEYDDHKSSRKRSRSQFIDDVAEEDEDEDDYDEDEDDEDDDDEEYYGGKGGKGRANKKKNKKKRMSKFFEEEAYENGDDEDEEDIEPENGFIVDDNGTDLPDDEDSRRLHRQPLLPREDDQEDLDTILENMKARYARATKVEYEEEATEVEQQALLPSVRDPKLWMVKCAIGHEREVAVCLMQKCIDKGPDLQIKSAIALEHLKNYIYIEADKEAHVKEACKGMRYIFTGSKILLVPIKEMTDVLSVKSKVIELTRDTWVRMKIRTYKGDLAKVVDVDNVRQRVTVKLIPRIDLQALANKLEGREVPRKKTFTPPPRFMNVDEAREMHIRVERKRDPITGDFFESINGMMFKDGFLYKTVSVKSTTSQGIQPSFDELEKFRQPDEDGDDDDMASLSTLFANRKKGHFMKGDRVIIVKGDLKNLKGVVEKVEEETVYLKPYDEGLPKTLAVSEKELCKCFEPGNHVKVVSGASEGATGLVVTAERHLVNIVSDTTKEVIQVFSDYVVESSEVTSGKTRIGDYELHDLVVLDNMSFGVIIRVDNETFQVLKGGYHKPEVALVRLREIKYKIERKNTAQDRSRNIIAVKDIVKILDGPSKGKQGPVEHIYKGILFIYDRHHLEHAGYICVNSQSCMVVGGRTNGDRNGNPASRIAPKTPHRVRQSPGRMPGGGHQMNSMGRFGGGRGQQSLIGTTIRVRLGNFKGCIGVVREVKGQTVRIALEAQMKIVTVNRDAIVDMVASSTASCEKSRYGAGSETPLHPSRTPMHPYMTPMRDSGATPIHDGMRTPMRDRAWNPYTPMSPPRDNWEDGNPASWGTSPHYQPGSPPSKTYEAPTPGSGWANTPSGSYSEAGTPRDSSSPFANAPSPNFPSTPGGQPPMTPSSAYLPGTPGGQPMTPGGGGLDMMSPVLGGDHEGPWILPNILVNVRRSAGETILGVVQDLLPDGSCRVVLCSSGETVTVPSNEVDAVVPRKSDKVKIMGGIHRGVTGKLIGVDGTDGIVKLDDTLEVNILDMAILAKQP
ncbi:Transcription elongation factor SPT5 [Heracleum sosnowskyi]|uniref:Transcription elongation factor SPT5 n=1 Tax=Heracleum sosnowskyi TaxID=360622 RepID=A0AAD8HRU5_9APIA|nr:Transcription elongation factor SPT5 [Heracleum sosnowskyi]